MGILKVNEEQCIGCGACVAIDPEHFDFNENGLSSVIKNENLESANLKSAMESCPTGAISFSEESNEEPCNCCEACTGQKECDCGCDTCKCGCENAEESIEENK